MPFINRFRLPLKLGAPQFIDEREVFRKSNGTTVVLSDVIRKQYQLTTDYLPEALHERIKIALSHDTVNIEGEKYIGGIIQEGGYEINWPEFLNFPLAPATVTVEVQGYAARNTNCGTCAEYSQVVTEDDNIGTIGEDETVIVPILYNDSICCSPFAISVVIFNTDYLDSAVVVDNTLVIHTKTGLQTQNEVVLATYRVTCENGMYDEANVTANVEGSIEQCLSPRNLESLIITGISAFVRWRSPSPSPACDFVWNLYLASDLGTPIQSGTHPASIFPPYLNFLTLNSLSSSTNYVLQVASDCCDGNVSPFVSLPFTTNPPEESEICGEYLIEFTDGCGFNSNYLDFQYLDCNNTFIDVTLFHASPITRCLKQDSPGSPTYTAIIGYYQNDPVYCDLPYNLTVTYQGPC
jgi:hypothetical protein